MIALSFTVIYFTLLGLALSRLVGSMQPFLCGAGVNGLALYIAGLLHIPLRPVVIVLALGSIAVLLRTRRRARVAHPAIPPAATAVLVAGAGLLLALAVIRPLTDYDGRAFWLLKARAIAHEQKIDGPFFQGKTVFSPRNEYPLLVPIDAATVMMLAGDDQRHTRGLFALFLVALALEVRRRLADQWTPFIGGWLGALILWLPQLSGQAGGALSAGSDVPLAAFAGCAFLELTGAHRAEDGRSPLRFGFWLAFLILTKSEGVAFAAFLFVAGLAVFRRRIVLTLTPVSVALLTLFTWRSRLHPTDEENLFGLLTRLPERWRSIDDATVAFARHFAAFGEWGLFWIAAFVCIGALVLRREWRPLALAGSAILPMFATYVTVYVVTDWDMAELVRVTADRLVSHFVVPGAYLIGAALAERP